MTPNPKAMNRAAGDIDLAGPIPAPPASHLDLLTRPLFAQVATIRPDGAPQNSVMWFGWDGSQVTLVHARRGQKYRNLTADPRVSIAIADPELPYRSLELRGVVAITADPGGAHFRELAARYGRPELTAAGPDDRVQLIVRPTGFVTTGGAAQ